MENPPLDEDKIKKICSILNEWDLSFFISKFRFNNNEDSNSRMQHILGEYFATKDSNLTADNTQKDIDIISSIFPQIPIEEIRSLFDEIGNESNRSRIVLRRLLKRTHNETFSVPAKESTHEPKKIKTFVQPDEQMPSTSGLNNFNKAQPSTSHDVTKDKINSESKKRNFRKLDPDSDSSANSNEALDLDLIRLSRDPNKIRRFCPANNFNDTSVKNNVEENHLANQQRVLRMLTDPGRFPINNLPFPVTTIIVGPNVNIQDNNAFGSRNGSAGAVAIPISNLQECFPDISLIELNRICEKHYPKNLQSQKIVLDDLISDLIDYSAKNVPPKNNNVNGDQRNQNVAPAPIVPQNAPPKNVKPKVNQDVHDLTLDIDMEKQNQKQPEMETLDMSVVYRLLEIFPEACPQYIRRLCATKQNKLHAIDELISEILASDYPKRQKDSSPDRSITADEQLEIMKQVLPNADPTFLKALCDRLMDKPDELKLELANLIETQNYPTMKDFLRKQQISAQQKQYTTEFKLEKFLEVIPDPISHFSEAKKRNKKLLAYSVHYALVFLRNHFPMISLNVIRNEFKKSASNILKTCDVLEKADPRMLLKTKRAPISMPEPPQQIPLLQEIAFIQYRTDILAFIKNRQEQEEKERKEAKEVGLMQSCACCYDDEVMPKDVFCCENGCKFCKSCVSKSVEVAFGDAKLDFHCLSDCDSQFSLQVLQAVLPPKMFSVIALKKQVQEVKAAGIEDLETCPFCDFASIPAKDDKLFRCLNPECMKESCRQCKEPSHIPLRCDEVEKEDDVKIRTFIENKMTEALLRKCYKCGMKFIKDDNGCNKMTCSCGAMMCYICAQPVDDYKHFNGPGGDKMNLCPLYSDTHQLHKEAVLNGAQKAKEEIGVASTSMKNDPTADVTEHYRALSRKRPVNPVAHVVNAFQNVHPRLVEEQRMVLERINEGELRMLHIQDAINRNILVGRADFNQRHRHRHNHQPRRHQDYNY